MQHVSAINSKSINTSKQKPRIDYIDNLRVLACFLVLLTHSTMPIQEPEKEMFWEFALFFIGTPASELFLALSGTVLLPVETGFRHFYKRRFIKLLPPLIIWSVLGVLLFTRTQDLPWNTAWDLIIHIPVQPAIGVYWFVYAIAGLYLFAPFISPWLKTASKRQIEFFLTLWLINLIIPWILQFYPNFAGRFSSSGSYYWVLYCFGGFLGYWLMGYYLNKYPIKIGRNYKWIALMALFIAYPVFVFIARRHGYDINELSGNLQIGSAVCVAFLYTLLQNISFSNRIQKAFTGIAKYSFGIYLTHVYIARELYWGVFDGSHIHIFPRTFLIALLTLITGYVLTRLMAFLPKGKYIIGV